MTQVVADHGAQAKVALRLRRDGEEVIQTLMTRGHSVAGLSERNEYDWHRANTRDDLKIVGKVNAGWPNETLVAATTLKDNGLAPAVTDALNSVIKDGSYGKVLARWGLSEEALPSSETVTAANYKAGAK